MRRWVLTGLALAAACGYTGPATDDGPDAAVDAGVRFVSVTANTSTLRPGLYGIEIVAVLRNDLAVEISGVDASPTFADATADRAGDFRWRDFDRREGAAAPRQTAIAPGAEATYRFKVDALPWAIPPGPIRVNGAASFTDGTTRAATPLERPLALDFVAMNPPIVVTEPDDENDGDANISFREALGLALADPGLDRIVFDATRFPSGTTTTTVLVENLGALPSLTGAGGDLVIDGSGAGFVLAVDSNWESPEGRYGLRISGSTVVIHGVAFRNMGYQYRNENVSTNNCGASGAQLEGGAIRVDGGTLVLDGNTFADPGVAERNCFAASVRIHGGSGHRILGNHWTDPSMDSIFIDAAAIEITDNVMDAGANPNKADEGIYVNSQGSTDLWIVGNLIVDQEYSAVIGRGTDAGTLFVVNNTFVRNGRVGLSAVRREQGARTMVLRNNAYVGNQPAAIQDGNTGAGLDIAYEAVTGVGGLCPTCTTAMVDLPSITYPADPMVADPTGTTIDDFTPQAGSPWLDSATDWLDRNGANPGRYTGTAPERGAIERP